MGLKGCNHKHKYKHTGGNNMFRKLFGKKAAKSENFTQKAKGFILTCDEIGYSQKNKAFRSFSVKTIAQLEKLEKELRQQLRYENFRIETIY
jgi:hypothetical protein